MTGDCRAQPAQSVLFAAAGALPAKWRAQRDCGILPPPGPPRSTELAAPMADNDRSQIKER